MRIRHAVSQTHARNIDSVAGRVVEFDPIRPASIRFWYRGVVGKYFIDHDTCLRRAVRDHYSVELKSEHQVAAGLVHLMYFHSKQVRSRTQLVPRNGETLVAGFDRR